MARILVVDDDKKIVRLVRSYLEQNGYHVLTAHDGETALHTIRREKPDLVVLDLMLPDRDGWEITRIVRSDQALVSLPIIMLTARVEDVDKIVGLEMGADDYITKPFNPREVVARVKALLRRAGGAAMPPPILQIGELRMDIERRSLIFHDQVIDLTPTEFDLLKMFMEHPGRPFTRQELIENGLGYAYVGMERTIDSHIKNLRKKIGAESESPAYIETVHRIGYRLRGEM